MTIAIKKNIMPIGVLTSYQKTSDYYSNLHISDCIKDKDYSKNILLKTIAKQQFLHLVFYTNRPAINANFY